MLIISQNLANYDMPIPQDAIFRFNLAWIGNLNDLKKLLKKHENHPIFLDVPVKRVKPPNNTYTIEDLIPIIKSNKNIKYFAISNVEKSEDLTKYVELIPYNVIVVPKIENMKGISNIESITNALPYKQKIVMLDHDDLYSSLSKSAEPASKFKEYVNKIIDFCGTHNVKLLRTRGVIFSDDEKRII